MNVNVSARSERVRSLAVPLLVLTLGSASTLGCNSANQPDHNLRADLAAIRTAHGDPDAIGALDATAPPPNLDEYRRPSYRTASAH